MVMAKLHIICGNCGALSTEMNHYVDEKLIDIDGEQLPAVVIDCKNCGTMHVLEDTVKVNQKRIPKSWLSNKR